MYKYPKRGVVDEIRDELERAKMKTRRGRILRRRISEETIPSAWQSHISQASESSVSRGLPRVSLLAPECGGVQPCTLRTVEEIGRERNKMMMMTKREIERERAKKTRRKGGSVYPLQIYIRRQAIIHRVRLGVTNRQSSGNTVVAPVVAQAQIRMLQFRRL